VSDHNTLAGCEAEAHREILVPARVDSREKHFARPELDVLGLVREIQSDGLGVLIGLTSIYRNLVCCRAVGQIGTSSSPTT